MNDNESSRSASPNPPISSSADNRPQDTLVQRGAFDAPSTPGTLGRLDKYEILRFLGEGAMGQVYLAREPVTGVQVALKIIKPQLADDPREVHRFLNEARHMYGMSHPHVLRVLDVSDRKEGPYYVMPYVEGGSLHTLCKPGQALPESELLPIAKQVAGALAYAHSHGIIHRDLKPANVLLDKQGNASLSDFGLVRTVFNDSMVDPSASHLEGTAPYMSPAVARGDAEDTRCDIYAFGAVLYELLTGNLPYTGRTQQIILDQVLKGPPPPIRTVNPKANPALVTIAEGCMARELRDRYAAMSDVASDLDRVSKGKPPLGPRGQVGLGKRINLRRLAIPVAVSLACAALAIGLWQGAARWRHSDGSMSGWRATLEKAANAYDENRFEAALGLFDTALAAIDADLGSDPTVRKLSQDKARKGRDSARFVLDRSKFPLPEQIEMTQQKLAELNTNYTGKGTFTATKDGRLIAELQSAGITDLTPLKGLPLSELNLDQNPVVDLTPLRGQPLKSLNISHSKVITLSPLNGMTSLTNLICCWTGIRDVGPLQGLPLKGLHLYATQVSDLSPLAGMPLDWLQLAFTQVSDLRPLKGMRLQRLQVGDCFVTDISPLKDMPLVDLEMFRSRVTDLSPLRTLKALANFQGLDPKPLLNDLYTALRTNDLARAKEEAASLIADCQSVPAFSNVVSEAREIQTALAQLAQGDTGPYAQYWLKHLKERGIVGNYYSYQCDTNGLLSIVLSGLLGKNEVTLAALQYVPLRYVDLQENSLTNLQALAGLPLTGLSLYGNPVTDLSPLRGMKLEILNLRNTSVTDLAPIEGMPLKSLDLSESAVVDLGPLKGMTSLTDLGCGRTGVRDVGPLQGLKLVLLDLDVTSVVDLAPLRGMPLKTLRLSDSKIIDLSPLKGMTSLTELNCNGTAVRDLGPLQGMPLKRLGLHSTRVSDLAPLEGMPLEDLVLEGAANVASIAALRGMELTSLHLNGTKVSDVTVVQGMPLKELWLQNTRVAGLPPLDGMPLTGLSLDGTPMTNLPSLKGVPLTDLGIPGTKISDLTALSGLPLRVLYITDTPVADLSPLKGMSLSKILLGGTKVRDLSPLKGMKSLTVIGDFDVAGLLLADLRRAVGAKDNATVKTLAPKLIADWQDVPAMADVVKQAKEMLAAAEK